jgi:mannose-6-phosphate isomerase-like protein (cupin superfamily)
MPIAPPLAGRIIGSTESDFLIAEWTADPAQPGEPPMHIAPLHLHRSDDEAWYVLEGTLVVRSGSEDIEARAGACVLVPRGTPHTYWNPNSVPARYLLIMTPRIYQLIEAIHAMPVRTMESVRAVFARYDSQLLE